MTELTLETRAPLSSVTVAPDHASGVSWAAVIAGAFVASAFSLALVALGAGIGLISVSPWSNNNPSVTTFTVLAAAWFIAVELFACGVGGYIAGRLRVGWARVHTDEVYFRDTAHGLLVWAVGAVMTAILLAWAASSAVSGAAHLAGAATEAVGQAAGAAAGQAASTLADPTAYFADMLFRSDHPAQGDQAGAQAEAGPILARALYTGDLSAPDKTYLAQLVASRTRRNGSPMCSTRRRAPSSRRRTRPRRRRTPPARRGSTWRSGPSSRSWSALSQRAIWRPSAAGSGTKRRCLISQRRGVA